MIHTYKYTRILLSGILSHWYFLIYFQSSMGSVDLFTLFHISSLVLPLIWSSPPLGSHPQLSVSTSSCHHSPKAVRYRSWTFWSLHRYKIFTHRLLQFYPETLLSKTLTTAHTVAQNLLVLI